MGEAREHDVVLFGATGFIGRLTAAYLAETAPAGTRIGLAGRSADRLATVRDGLGPTAADWSLLLADLTDATSLANLASRTRVLAVTTGPFSRRADSVVQACVEAGTDYLDTTGEVLFMHDSIARFHAQAASGGTRIVHGCGFDSIPSDLGVHLIAQRARADGAGDLLDTITLVSAFRASLSGGTLATMRSQLEEEAADAARHRIVADPYALSPDRAAEPDFGPQPDLRLVAFDRRLRLWLAGFVMAPVNTRVVRRSNALSDWSYGRRFRYREALAFRGGVGGAVRAAASVAPVELLRDALGWEPTRRLLGPRLPPPGTGPDEAHRRAGRFELLIVARTADGSRYIARVAASGDPGYSASSVMFGQAALCLALDRGQLPARGGVLTPAVAMGTRLVERLRDAGLTFEVEQRAPRPGTTSP
jgi:short subunit dehydrogenase-like uncharacterized protein